MSKWELIILRFKIAQFQCLLMSINAFDLFPVKTDTEKNDNSSLVIGVGVGCFLLGAIIGGLVNVIINRNRRKTKLR